MMTSSEVSFGQAMSGPYSSLVVFRTKEGLWLESENVMVFEPQFPFENKKLQNGNGIDKSVFRGLGKTRKLVYYEEGRIFQIGLLFLRLQNRQTSH